MRLLFYAVAMSMALPAFGANFSPTTTLSVETGNNTSASSHFSALPNGDCAPGNVSKISIHSLAPQGFTGKFFAHYMPWWGSHGHRDIGYSSQDSAQISKIVADMKSRGYDGVVLAEANTQGFDQTGASMLATVANSEGLAIIASENHLSKAGDPTALLLNDMSYFNSHFFNLNHYYRVNGRPIVMVFDNASVDWNAVSNAAPGQPLFILRNQSALTNTKFFGGFSWFGSFESSDNRGLSYLDGFYGAALSHPSRFAAGDFWPGFNDTLAKWTKNRVMPQHCGATWLQSLGKITQYYSNNLNALPVVQVASWDDYEEGTEVETGIDNCASISASYSGSSLSFAPSFSSPDGNENTVDHYEVFASQDGASLMLLSKLPVGSRNFKLSRLDLPAGADRLFVKMVGKSHILNHMSNEVMVSEATNSAPASAASGITISNPLPDSSVASPVHVILAIKETFSISRIQIWDSVTQRKIDDVKPGASQYLLSKSYLLKSGMVHRLTIQVKDEAFANRDHATISFSVK